MFPRVPTANLVGPRCSVAAGLRGGRPRRGVGRGAGSGGGMRRGTARRAAWVEPWSRGGGGVGLLAVVDDAAFRWWLPQRLCCHPLLHVFFGAPT